MRPRVLLILTPEYMSSPYEYDLVVIGAGAAGLTAAGIGANLGVKTIMIERDKLGGDCTWTGCVPSKTLLHAASVAHTMRTAGHIGIESVVPKVDFGKVMETLRATRQEIYEDADAPENFEKMGVEVAMGDARFEDAHTLVIDSAAGARRITGRYFIIAAGSRASTPPIDGLRETPYLTNENLFDLDTLPTRLAIIGGGPIGTEMAQAFRRLGSEVVVIEKGDRILGHDDAELAAMLLDALKGEGVTYHFGASATRVDATAEGVVVTLDAGAPVNASHLLVAVGRQPNTEGLNLDSAGVSFDKKGITVDEHCRTSQHHIFAVGDVTGRFQFTHMSEHMGKIAAMNALLKLPSKIDTDHVPWVTYTQPELAHVGATEQQLNKKGTSFETYRFPYARLDRAVTEHAATGLIKVHARGLDGKIYGASVLGERGGELISSYALAMRNGVTLRNIADTILPYPTYGLGVRRAADQWYAQKQSPTLIKLLQTVFGYRGDVPDIEEGRIV